MIKIANGIVLPWHGEECCLCWRHTGDLWKESQAQLELAHCDCQWHGESFQQPGSNHKREMMILKVQTDIDDAQFMYILIDENDINVITLEETFEAILHFTDGSICIHKEVLHIKKSDLNVNYIAFLLLLSTTIKFGCLFLFISPIPPKRKPTQVS